MKSGRRKYKLNHTKRCVMEKGVLPFNKFNCSLMWFLIFKKPTWFLCPFSPNVKRAETMLPDHSATFHIFFFCITANALEMQKETQRLNNFI